MSKFKQGDKVEVVGYGHLTTYFGRESFNNSMKLSERLNKNIMNMFLWGTNIPDDIKNQEVEEKDYSHLIYKELESGEILVDNSPNLVGKQGIVRGSYLDLYGGEGSANEEHFRKSYSLDGIPEKVAWYDEEQLKLIE